MPTATAPAARIKLPFCTYSSQALSRAAWHSLPPCDWLPLAYSLGHPPIRRRLPPRMLSKVPEQRRSEEHTSELQSPCNLVCRLLLEKKKKYLDIQSIIEFMPELQQKPQTEIQT